MASAEATPAPVVTEQTHAPNPSAIEPSVIASAPIRPV
jgi:hypothetical protein